MINVAHFQLLSFFNFVFPALGATLLTTLLGFSVARRGRGGARRSNNSRNNNNNRSASTLITGTQEIAQVTLGTPSGTFLGTQVPLIPTVSPGTRLSNLALQYSQYVIQHSRVTFVSQTTTNTSGRLLLAWTFDASEATPSNGFLINQMAASRMTPVWRNITTAMPVRSPEKRRYAVISGLDFSALSDTDKQIFLPATIVFGTDGSAQSGITVGSLIWHYRIRFFNPNVDLTQGQTVSTLGKQQQFIHGAPRFQTITAAPDDDETADTPTRQPTPSVAGPSRPRRPMAKEDPYAHPSYTYTSSQAASTQLQSEKPVGSAVTLPY